MLFPFVLVARMLLDASPVVETVEQAQQRDTATVVAPARPNAALPPAAPQRVDSSGAILQSATPTRVGRGQPVSLNGAFPRKSSDLYNIYVGTRRSGDVAWIDTIRARTTDEKSLSFIAPTHLPLGTYVLRVANSAVPGDFIVGEVTIWIIPTQPVVLRAVSPPMFYPGDSEFVAVTVSGSGFSTIPHDNGLVIGERAPAVRMCSPAITGNCFKGEVLDDGRTLKFYIPARAYRGAGPLRVSVADSVSHESQTLTFSNVRRGLPLTAAIVVLAALAGLVYLLTRNVAFLSEGKALRSFTRALLIDEKTNTYSLSRFQLLLWTATVIFGYVYLSASRMLVQGNLTIADIPDNLPGIILIAGSTTLLALGAEATRGSKGAGDEKPALSDFFTTGGVIAPERLQFFLWTLVGVATFVVATLSFDPWAIQTLPAIPERFLYLMGLSSFGYVGAKFIRQAGPTITDASVGPASPDGNGGAGGVNDPQRPAGGPAVPGGLRLRFELHGSRLSPDATFRISSMKAGEDPQAIPSAKIANGGRAQIVELDDDPAFGKTLTFVVPDAPAEWLQKRWWEDHRLTISNPDAKKAVTEVRVVGVPEGGDGDGGGGGGGLGGGAADGGAAPASPEPASAPPVNSEPAPGGGAASSVPTTASAPAITGIERRRRDAGDTEDALILKGTGFATDASLEVNGEKRAARALGPGELLLALTSADLARIEAGGDTSIVVVNPDGSRSDKRNFPS